jgi:hypothetical protein
MMHSLTPMAAQNAAETGIWYPSLNGSRLSEIPLLRRAARNLGNLTVRVVEDAEEAQQIVYDGVFKQTMEKHAGTSPEDKLRDDAGQIATWEATRLVRDMSPNQSNSQDPVRLVWIESTDGSPVLPYRVSEEIKFRVKPDLVQNPLSPDELSQTAFPS